VSETASELDRLRKKLAELDEQIKLQEARRANWGLGLRVGRRRFAYYRRVTAAIIFLSYVTFNIAGIIAGIVLISNKGAPRELGIAIVVGSIFAFGSFIAQWWSIEVQQEIDFVGRVYGSVAYQQHLGEMRNEITKILEDLNNSDKSASSGLSELTAHPGIEKISPIVVGLPSNVYKLIIAPHDLGADPVRPM
jgi:hypothetical protein